MFRCLIAIVVVVAPYDDIAPRSDAGGANGQRKRLGRLSRKGHHLRAGDHPGEEARGIQLDRMA